MVLTMPSPTGDDRLLARPSYQPIDVGAHCDSRDGDELDAVLGDSGDFWRFDNLGQNRHLHRFQHIAARQVDRCGPLEGQDLDR